MSQIFYLLSAMPMPMPMDMPWLCLCLWRLCLTMAMRMPMPGYGCGYVGTQLESALALPSGLVSNEVDLLK